MMDWKSQLQTHKRNTLILLGVIFVFLWIGFQIQAIADTKYQRDLKAWERRAAQTLRVNDSLNAVTKKLADSAVVLQKVADKQSAEIDKLRKSAGKHNKPRPQVPVSVPDTCKTLLQDALEYGDAQKERADILEEGLEIAERRDTSRVKTNMLLTESNGILRRQNDSLRTIIVTVPKYTPPKLLNVIPMPSRTMTFILGGIAGSLVTHQIVRATR